MKTYYDLLAAYPDQAALMRHLEARIAYRKNPDNEDNWFAEEETYFALDITEQQAHVICDLLDDSYDTVEEYLDDMRTYLIPDYFFADSEY